MGDFGNGFCDNDIGFITSGCSVRAEMGGIKSVTGAGILGFAVTG